LSFADDNGVEQVAKVEDKSFSFVDDEQKAAFESVQQADTTVQIFDPVAQQAAAPEKSGGIISGIRGLFRSP